MKTVTFAWIVKEIDFDSYQEAVKYIVDNLDKPWRFEPQVEESISKPYAFETDYEQRLNQYVSQFIRQVGNGKHKYTFDDKEVYYFWTVCVNMPYGKYNKGW